MVAVSNKISLMKQVLLLPRKKSVGWLPLQPPRFLRPWNRPHNSICGRWDCSDNNSVQYAHRATTFVIYSLLFSLIRARLSINHVVWRKRLRGDQGYTPRYILVLTQTRWINKKRTKGGRGKQNWWLLNDVVYGRPQMQSCNQIKKWVYSTSTIFTLFYTKRKTS